MCWLYRFLTDRLQCVRVGDVLSTQAQVMSGVPQGSVLGPYLFAIVAGSFVSSDVSCPLIKFADDFTFCFPIYKEFSNSHLGLRKRDKILKRFKVLDKKQKHETRLKVTSKFLKTCLKFLVK